MEISPDMENVLQRLRKLECFMTDTFGAKFVEFSVPGITIQTQVPAKRIFRNDLHTTSKVKTPTYEEADPLEDIIVTGTQSLLTPSHTNICSPAGLSGDIRLFGSNVSESAPIPLPVLPTKDVSISLISLPPATGGETQPQTVSTDTKADVITLDDDDDPLEKVNAVNSSECSLEKIATEKLIKSTGYLPPNQALHLRGRQFYIGPSINLGPQATGKSSFPSDVPKISSTTSIASKNVSKAESQRLESFKRPMPAALSTPSKRQSGTGSDDIIQCDQCHLYIYATTLDEHMKTHSVLDTRNAEKNSSFLHRAHKCPICKIVFSDLSAYEQHCHADHPTNMPCSICGKVLGTKVRLRRHLLIHENQKHTCDVCGKSYNRSDNLTAHQKTHLSEETTLYYCSFCKLAFSSRGSRDQHLLALHGGGTGLNSTPTLVQQETPTSSDLISATEITIKCDADSGMQFEYEGDDDDMT